ncbi:pleckstrin homology domain-containing family A member 3 isoform X3 [Conger conger]|uniref:pleckstrin homology domain-containing family A member 3 isoform X3 n=1 Tax=Conger conger TaxID=82655 RepID=UPI002A5A8AC5|nr:pleckstrin homology domain-containing family A member 3 isoform X3 [Conger conger]
MEGVLYKWTNYITGWQPRWFVLGNGILSYYDSQDDVRKGSKGSIKMSVCEIKVHPTDNTRLELIIPGEQHFYVKAVNAAERQKWLVVLGSSKACLIDTRTKKEKDITETTETLKTKMSELRLYCDLLTQQVHTIQRSADYEEADHTTSSTEMKRSISHPGTYSFDRTSHSPKEPVSSHQRLAQRRSRTHSDTESLSDGCTEELDRHVLCSKALVNGDSSSVIPEETSPSTRI